MKPSIISYTFRSCSIRFWAITTTLVSTAVAHPSMEKTPDQPQEVPAGLGGDWGGLFPTLESRGIVPHAVFVTEVLGNVSGGYGRGATTPGLAEIGLELDLEKLVGWKGGGFTISAFGTYGADGSAKFIGDFSVASNIYSATDFNIFNLFLSQTFGEELVFLKAGQLAVDDDFMGSDAADLFMNSAFGPLSIQSGNIGAPIFPLGAPGVFMRFTPEGGFYAQAGVYSGDAGPERSSNHGFEWRTGGGTGWVAFAEVGYDYGCGVVKFGGYHHTGKFEDFRNGKTQAGLSAIYGVANHRLIEAGTGSPGLSAFFRAAFTPEDERAIVSRNFDVGVVLDQLFLADDLLGFGVSQMHFGSDYRRATGSPGAETILELTYQFPVIDGWLIQPDVQYIIDPHDSRSDALVVGLRTELAF